MVAILRFGVDRGEQLKIAMVDDLCGAYSNSGTMNNTDIRIVAGDGIGGIATSGWQGRSFSLGIADAACVLAKNAALADATASLIANAVDVPSENIKRKPASNLDPDSDLGQMLVTVAVGKLTNDEIETALANGTQRAKAFL